MLGGEEAEDRAIALYASWCDGKQSNVPADVLIVRTFLVQSIDLKRFWAHDHAMGNEIGLELRFYPLPKLVWVTEFGSLKEFSESCTVFGFVVQDASVAETSESIANFVLVYMPSGSLWVKPDRTYDSGIQRLKTRRGVRR